MVELSTMRLMYLPLAAEGFALTTELMTVSAFSCSFCKGRASSNAGEFHP